MNHKNSSREIPLLMVIIPIALTVFLLIMTVFYLDSPLYLPLLMGYFFSFFIAFIYHRSVKELLKATYQGIHSIAAIISILVLIGVLIAIWSSSGTIDALVYYGLAIVNPKYLVVISFLVSSMISMLLGTSVGTMSTVGVAFMGIAHSLSIDTGLVAGALVSGAFVGDRTSPLSSAAQINALVTGANYYDEVSRLIKTLLPVILISAIIYFFIDLYWVQLGQGANVKVEEAMNSLKNLYGQIPLWLLLPPISILIFAFFKVPTKINLTIGILIGIILAYIFQDKDLFSILIEGIFGYQHPTGKVYGGGWNMLHQIVLIVVAGAFYGMLESTGMLATVLRKLTSGINGPVSLVKKTMVISIFSAALSSTQVIGIMVPGKTLSSFYKNYNLGNGLLYKSIADSGMVVAGLIPWNLNALLLAIALNVEVVDYLPFAVLLFILPIYSFYQFKYSYLKKEKKLSRKLAEKVE